MANSIITENIYIYQGRISHVHKWALSVLFQLIPWTMQGGPSHVHKGKRRQVGFSLPDAEKALPLSALPMSTPTQYKYYFPLPLLPKIRHNTIQILSLHLSPFQSPRTFFFFFFSTCNFIWVSSVNTN